MLQQFKFHLRFTRYFIIFNVKFLSHNFSKYKPVDEISALCLFIGREPFLLNSY